MRPRLAARSLYGHLLVQWSPFLPQMRQTSRLVFWLAKAASGSPDAAAFSASAFAFLPPDTRSRKISSTPTAVMPGSLSPGFRPALPPNFFQLRRSTTTLFTFLVTFWTRIFLVIFT